MTAKRAAVIDIGTNSIKLLVAERAAEGFRVVEERVVVARLGAGLSSHGRLSAEAISRASATVAEFADAARKNAVSEIAVYGTHAVRGAANGAEFTDKIKELTGIEVRELSGEEEASYSFNAAATATGSLKRTLVFDAGGGSTEFILGYRGEIIILRSTPVGALTLLDRCMAKNDPPSPQDFADASSLALEIFGHAGAVVAEARKDSFALVGVGGVISVLASVDMELNKFSREKINGFELSRGAVEKQACLYCSLTAGQRRFIPGMPTDRAQIAPAGAALALAVFDFTGRESLIVSANGLRYGAMAELLGQ